MKATENAEWFADELTKKFAGSGGASGELIFTAMGGRRFDKIVKEYSEAGGKSVHAFVERETGHVYKAESWNKPAKGVRFASTIEALEAADKFGGYLYVA